MFFRKFKTSSTGNNQDAFQQLDSEIEKYQNLIESAPRKLLEQRERERTTMPAPDDFSDRRRERRFYAELSKGQIRNERRYRTRNTVLFVLLTAASLSVCWWIYTELMRNGVLT